ncbi:site-specific integrase [Arthrobacter sp. ISL-69]|uniref:tyrosine-type recombinase/integrase n=1 Tax=Arthrobacter sp. ISL-69 TaxID=2819113 RepID=UPI001BE68EC6|nr:site-specific integrase [Arthrobacter sp. ISL-69]MBT2535889.1 site-specific integrase [Arthrobacter sp. ISL-69]
MARAWIQDEWLDANRQPTARNGTGSRWRVYWWEETQTGRRRRSKRFQRKPDAQQYAAKLDNDLRAGTYRPPEHAETLLADVAAEWLSTRLDIKPATYLHYERSLRAYVLPQWGSRRIGTITKPDVAAWISALAAGTALASGKVRGSKPARFEPAPMRGPLKPSSIGHIHTVLSAVLAWAVETDRISRNPAAGARLPRVAAPEQVYLSHGQVEDLAVAAQDLTGRSMDGTLVRFLAYTGLRINEALALKVSALDLMRARAAVNATWTLDRAGKKVLGTPKSHEKRAVPLGFLVTELQELTAGQAQDAYVFQTPTGEALNDHNWRNRVFNLAARDADLDGLGVTPHKLRHTAASAAIGSGADVKVVQLMLGHKDATETLNTYGHLWPDRLDEVSASLEAARRTALAARSHVSIMSPRSA